MILDSLFCSEDGIPEFKDALYDRILSYWHSKVLCEKPSLSQGFNAKQRKEIRSHSYLEIGRPRKIMQIL